MALLTHRARWHTAGIGVIGALLFWVLGLPLPFLLGPLFACLAAALGGVRMGGMGQIGVAMRTILGVAVGASVTPELIGRLPGMGLSVALVPLLVLVIGLAGYPFFRRVCKFDHPTAYYCAMPGGFQDMLVFGTEAGGDPRALSLVHATRVLLIVTIAPFLITTVWGMSLDRPPGAPAAELPPGELALMVAAAIVGWKGGERIGLFGASILGPMIVTAALSLAGFIHYRPPAEAILMAQFFIGVSVGVNYNGVTMDEIRRDVAAGAGFCVILFFIAFVFAEGVTLAGLAPPVDAFLAFAPGGQAEMAVLSIIAGADIAFVVTHHLVRLIVVISGAPIVSSLLSRAGSDSGDSEP